MPHSDKTDKQALIPYEDKPIVRLGSEDSNDINNEGIVPGAALDVIAKEKTPEWREIVVRFIRFAAIGVAFAAIFFSIFLLRDIGNDTSEGDGGGDINASVNSGTQDTDRSENAVISDIVTRSPLLLIDESLSGIDPENIDSDGYDLSHLMSASGGVRVIIIHSHNSERVSENMSVNDAGEALASLLNASGIGVYHAKTVHDAEGSIGAYGRMNKTLNELTKDFPDAVCVIDLHDSDSGLPLTFTVGTGSEYAWSENLLLAVSLYRQINGVEGALRLLPSDLGQSNGRLSLHLGIGGYDTDDLDARRIISEIALALIKICTYENYGSTSTDP